MVELSVLSSWNEMIKGQIKERISKRKQNFKQSTGKMLQLCIHNADVKACLFDQHNKYVWYQQIKLQTISESYEKVLHRDSRLD